MNELIEAIQTTIRHEVKNSIQTELKDTIRQEVRDIIKTELKDTIRQEVRDVIQTELKDTIKQEIKAEIGDKFDKLNLEIKNIKEALFVIEHEHGRKIDAIYDLFNLDKEINKPKFDEISIISKKTEQNYLHILNHENRISTLEEKTL